MIIPSSLPPRNSSQLLPAVELAWWKNGSLSFVWKVNGFSFLAKLKELNGGAPQEHKLSEEVLESLEGLLVSVCSSNSDEPLPSIQQINLLWKASHWPEGTVFQRNKYLMKYNLCHIEKKQNWIFKILCLLLSVIKLTLSSF